MNRFLCPKCNFWLSPTQMRRKGKPYFQCPSCEEKLRFSPTYMRSLNVAGFALAFVLPAILQIQNPFKFVGVALLAWIPLVLLMTYLLNIE
jgi:hypothetical protein